MPKSALFGAAPPQDQQLQFQVDSALQGEEGLRKIQAAAAADAPYAMAFVDVRMPPGWDGVETIARVWKQFPDLQVVICTAYSDYSWEKMIRQIGKSDSLLILKKPFDNIEVLQLAHALTQKWSLNHQVNCRLNDLDHLVTQRTNELESANEQLKKEIAERLQAEHVLRLSEERFSKAFKASPIPMAIQSLLDEKFVDANRGFLNLTGYSSVELIGQTANQLQIWAEPASESAMLDKLRREMAVRNLQSQFRSKTGRMFDILLSVEVIELDGKPFLLIIALDITEQIRLETQLLQAQKMEAVGQLAAGVAHDFNNILTVVQGNASVLLAGTPPESENTKPLRSICAAADRASTLVRQLLTFSRKQQAHRCPVNISDILGLVSEMLPRALTELITLKVQVPPGLPEVSADGGDDGNPAHEPRRQRPRRHARWRHPQHRRRRPRCRPRGRALQSRCPRRPVYPLDSERHRQWHPGGSPAPDLRAVFHHQTGRQRHRPWAGHRLWHCPSTPRLGGSPESDQPRHHLPRLHSRPACRRTTPKSQTLQIQPRQGRQGNHSRRRGRAGFARPRRPGPANLRLPRPRRRLRRASPRYLGQARRPHRSAPDRHRDASRRARATSWPNNSRARTPRCGSFLPAVTPRACPEPKCPLFRRKVF